MTTYFVGPSSAGLADGSSWDNRYGSFSDAEDTPVVPDDIVIGGPGVYREQVTLGASGSSGQPITYIGDVSGELTDGVGGIVRITASDDDQSGTRDYCIYATGKSYRTFRGFVFDMATKHQIYFTNGCNGLIIEDCFFGTADDDVDNGVYLMPAASDLLNINRCVFMTPGRGIFIYPDSDIALNSSSVIENCLFIGGGGGAQMKAVNVTNTDSLTIKNCMFNGILAGIRVGDLATSQKVDVNNCIFERCGYAISASVLGEIVEDYNSVPLSNENPRMNVNVGGNSNIYPALFEMPVLLEEYALYPWKFGELSKWSQLAGIAGTGEASYDLYGIVRPATSAKKSWGAIQYQPIERETTTTYDSSDASIKLPDAGLHQIFVPVTAVETTISVRVYREVNHAGTNPRMYIKQPGVSTLFNTDVGSAETWNLLTRTFTPDAGTDYVVVELRSLNTAIAGSYAVYFDALSVS